MVKSQLKGRGIDDARVLEAFKTVPRHEFLDESQWGAAYGDHPLPIGHGQTISQPYIVALMTTHLNLSGSEKVLEIGTGSGYQTGILAHLAKEVHSVEIIPELSQRAGEALRRLQTTNVHLHVGDGSPGWPLDAPYDRILVTAAAPEISADLISQLADGGLLVAPVGERWRQVLEVWKKSGEKVVKEKILPVVFVPLRGQFGWQD